MRSYTRNKPARNDDHQIHQAVKQARGGVEGGHRMIGLFLDGLEGLVAFFKLFVFLRFSGKRFDNALAQQAVLDRGVQLADLEALLAESGAQAQV